MLTGSLVFLDIDTQRDFFAGGALPVPRADEIRRNLARLLTWAQSHNVPVIATACAHTPETLDPEPWPLHCVLGTRGQERIEETAMTGSRVLDVGSRWSERDRLPRHFTVHKTQYDVFSRADFDDIVTAYSRDRCTFVVFGLATDYCVRAAVDGLLQRELRIAIVVDAIRAIDADGETRLLTAWALKGVLLVLTEVVCAETTTVTSGDG